MGMNELIGKKIILELKNGSKYFGVLNSVDDCGNGLIFVDVTNKFGKVMVFAISEIIRFEEDRE